jgi:hypothetical protein
MPNWVAVGHPPREPRRVRYVIFERDAGPGAGCGPYPPSEWVGYSHATMLDYVRKMHRENAIGGELRHAGSREAGRVTVTDAAGRVLIDYRWVTMTSEELEAQE